MLNRNCSIMAVYICCSVREIFNHKDIEFRIWICEAINLYWMC